MTQETIPYLHGNCLIGGVRGGALLIGGKTVIPTTVDLSIVDAKFRAAFEDATKAQPGWRPPSWWFQQSLEDNTAPSHYAGYLPVSLVKERLFNWEALDATVKVSTPLTVPGVGADDGSNVSIPAEFIASAFKAIVREDKLREAYQFFVANGNAMNALADDGSGYDSEAKRLRKELQAMLDATVLGMHSDEYTAHQLAQTFITETGNIIGGTDELGITSALVLRGGRVASMEISIPEELHNDLTGFSYRPNLVVSTSFNGTLPTSWTRTITATVCDNTLQYALSQAGETGKYKVRHTKNSLVAVRDAAQALGLIHQQADAFDETLKSWFETEVTEKHFQAWLDKAYEIPDAKVVNTTMLSETGEKMTTSKVNTNSQSLVMNKRDKLIQMWDGDPRVIGPDGQWKNTLLGFAQLVNTNGQHNDMVKGIANFGGNRVQARVESNQFKVLKGEFEKKDAEAMKMMNVIISQDEAPVKVLVGASVGGSLAGNQAAAAVAAPAPAAAPVKRAPAKRKPAAKKTTGPTVKPLPSGDDSDSVNF